MHTAVLVQMENTGKHPHRFESTEYKLPDINSLQNLFIFLIMKQKTEQLVLD